MFVFYLCLYFVLLTLLRLFVVVHGFCCLLCLVAVYLLVVFIVDLHV